MSFFRAPGSRRDAVSLSLVLLIAGTLVAGTFNVTAAHDFSQHYVSGNFLNEDIKIVGLPSVYVWMTCVVGVVAAAMAGLIALRRLQRVWGMVCAAVAALCGTALWVDTAAVSSIKGIVEQVGPAYPWGGPQTGVNHAGWLFVGAVALSLILLCRVRRNALPPEDHQAYQT